jgi:hypothetical protein
MEITQIMAYYGRTYNLGNFQSAKIEFSATGTLDDSDNLEEQTKALWEFCRKQVNDKAQKIGAGLVGGER